MNKTIFAGVKIVITLLVISVVLTCNQSPLGYGVVLWGIGKDLTTGMVVELIEESDIENHYMVRDDSLNRDTQLLPITRWRLQEFTNLNEANVFSDTYHPFYVSYAYANRNGLPVRKTPSATADIVYKLRDGELVKVIDRSETQQKVGVFESYWFQIITDDGTKGHTFGEFLPVFESDGDPYVDAARLHSEDPTLDHLLGTVWWPEYYLPMIRQGRYDLNRFREEYGLFPNGKANMFRLVTEKLAYEFNYDSIERVGDNRYKLNGSSGTEQSVRFVVQTDTRLIVSFLKEGRQITKVFLGYNWDIGRLISIEQERRALIYTELINRTRLLRSNQYGNIHLGETGHFHWEGFQALAPIYVPVNFSGSGRVEFRYALGASLSSRYDGVITFVFDDSMTTTEITQAEADGATINSMSSDSDRTIIEKRPEIELNLLVKYTENGLRMTPAVPNLETLEVTDDNLSPVVMFFSFVDDLFPNSSD